MDILVILSRIPYPLEKGDKLRAFHQIRELSAKHSIHLFCLNDSARHPQALEILGKYCKTIEIHDLSKINILIRLLVTFFTGNPFQVGYFYSPSAKRKVQAMIEQIRPDHIYCQLIRTAPYAFHSRIPKTIDYQDVFSKGVERRIEFSPFWLKPILKMEYQRLLKYEHAVFVQFDHKTIISESDRIHIPHPGRNSIHIIPNGVDHQYFTPVEGPKTTDLLFTGNMGYSPNIQCARFLATQVMPGILKIKPGTRLKIVGANPDPSLAELASANVEIIGWVDDIRQSYNAARIFIAPMQIGTGLQNKLLEAMAMKLPCITSELANKSLGATPGKEILIGNSAEEYAALVVRLLEDSNFAKEIAENGNHFVRATFDWSSTTAKLENVIAHK